LFAIRRKQAKRRQFKGVINLDILDSKGISSEKDAEGCA
jgi:hypothetical protein